MSGLPSCAKYLGSTLLPSPGPQWLRCPSSRPEAPSKTWPLPICIVSLTPASGSVCCSHPKAVLCLVSFLSFLLKEMSILPPPLSLPSLFLCPHNYVMSCKGYVVKLSSFKISLGMRLMGLESWLCYKTNWVTSGNLFNFCKPHIVKQDEITFSYKDQM